MRIAGPNDRLRGAIRFAAALGAGAVVAGCSSSSLPSLCGSLPGWFSRSSSSADAGPGVGAGRQALDEDCPAVDIRTGAGTLAVAAKPQEPTANDLRYQLTFIELARQCFVEWQHRADAGRRAGSCHRRARRRPGAGQRADPLRGRSGRRPAQDHRDQVPARSGGRFVRQRHLHGHRGGFELPDAADRCAAEATSSMSDSTMPATGASRRQEEGRSAEGPAEASEEA